MLYFLKSIICCMLVLLHMYKIGIQISLTTTISLSKEGEACLKKREKN